MRIPRTFFWKQRRAMLSESNYHFEPLFTLEMVNKSRVSLEIIVISNAASWVPKQFIGRRNSSPIIPAKENTLKLQNI